MLTPINVLLLTLHFAFVLLWSATAGLHYVTRVIGPTLEFGYLEEGKAASDSEQCGPSTDDINDFTLKSAASIDEAGEIMDEHGVAVVPSILQTETAKAFRDYVMKANHILPQIQVHQPENRYHIMPPHSEPIVQQVFNELAEQPKLRPLLDKLLGPEATLVIFSVVTNTFGSIDQDFHKDSFGEAIWPEIFVPEYQLAIALQDTTEEMGATSIIPGSTGCEWPALNWELFEEWYNNDEDLQRRYDTFDDYLRAEGLGEVDVKAKLDQGDGFLYHTATQHRGRGHTDPNAPDRALAFFTFVGSRQGKDDTRMLPLGQVYSLKWNMWGRTIEDMATLVKGRPWYFWKAFGLWNDRAGNVRPWNVLDSVFGVFRASSELCFAFGFEFTREDVERRLLELESYMIPLTFLYMLLLAMVLPLFMLFLEQENEGEGNVDKHKKVNQEIDLPSLIASPASKGKEKCQ
eukprot:scaffold171_cov151-Skeletonema_menzelii.AAC.1